MDSVFFQAMLLRPPKILGRQLHDFSCYHALLLTQLDSPFLISGTPSRAHIVELLYICGTQYEPHGKSIFDSTVIKDSFLWGKETGLFDVPKVVREINQYLADYMAFPRIWISDKNRRESGIPAPFRMAATILFGYPGTFTEVEVWNLSMAKASCYRAYIAEYNGMEVESKKSRELLDRIKDAGVQWVDPALKKDKSGHVNSQN